MITPKNINEVTKRLRDAIIDSFGEVWVEHVSEMFYHESDMIGYSITRLTNVLVIQRIDDDSELCLITIDDVGVSVYKSSSLRCYELITWMWWDAYKNTTSIAMRLAQIIQSRI